MILHGKRWARKSFNSTNFDLVRVTWLRRIFCTYRSLSNYCKRNSDEDQILQFNHFDFYLATKQEVAAAKQRQKQIEYDWINSSVDEF